MQSMSGKAFPGYITIQNCDRLFVFHELMQFSIEGENFLVDAGLGGEVMPLRDRDDHDVSVCS